jgi:hypothetical protein
MADKGKERAIAPMKGVNIFVDRHPKGHIDREKWTFMDRNYLLSIQK